MTDIPKFLTRDQASRYLKTKFGISRTPKTLAKLAVVGGGPRFRKDTRAVFYAPENLDAWVEDILSPPVSSTAEAASLKSQQVA